MIGILRTFCLALLVVWCYELGKNLWGIISSAWKIAECTKEIRQLRKEDLCDDCGGDRTEVKCHCLLKPED